MNYSKKKHQNYIIDSLIICMFWFLLFFLDRLKIYNFYSGMDLVFKSRLTPFTSTYVYMTNFTCELNG